MNGVSTGLAPTQDRVMNVGRTVHIVIIFVGLFFVVWFFFFLVIGVIITRIDASIAITPPNFDGIDRRIAYANRKYHSGLMWFGVLSGLASEKFSGSDIRFGSCVSITKDTSNTSMIGDESFVENFGWKLLFSLFVEVPVGFFDPVSCSVIRCMITRIVMIIGSRKCRARNRVRVGCDTENPPHIHSTMVFPMYGIADMKFVITVAPQKDICPHGRT